MRDVAVAVVTASLTAAVLYCYLRRRIAALEKDLAERKAGAPGPTRGRSLADAVAKWRRAGRPKAFESTAKDLHAKFVASGATFTFTYGNVKMFFAGLEGLLGSPSPEVMPTMTLEHTSEAPFEAWNSGVQRTTTPKAEWEYVTAGTVSYTHLTLPTILLV